MWFSARRDLWGDSPGPGTDELPQTAEARSQPPVVRTDVCLPFPTTCTSWVAGPKLLIARVKHAAIALPDRRILVVGGAASSVEGRRRFDSTELINVRSDDVSAGPSLSQGEYKLDGAIVELHDGRVVIAGGTHLDLFDPQTYTVAVLAQAVGPQLAFLSATAVAHRLVLIAGGYDRNIIPTSRAVLVTIPRRGG